MMPLIIDPPVGPYSGAGEIEAWIHELQAMRLELEHDRHALRTIDDAMEQARAWLEQPRSAESTDD